MKKLLIASLACLALNCHAQSFKLLETITNLTAPSGFEEPVANIIEKAWHPYLVNLQKDGMGNLVGSNKKKGKNTVLLMSHMDEVGFMVSHIEDNGMLRVQTLGGINDNVVMAQRYNILTSKGNITAYSGLEAVHIIPKEKSHHLITKGELFLDIGASSKQEAIEKFNVTPGLPVAPASKFTKLNEHRYLAKALDDRIGLSLLTDVMQNVANTRNKITFAATVQEEVGMRGAKLIYKETKPDVVFNIEIGIANDFPLRVGKKYSDVKLNNGPTLFILDGSMIPNQKLIEWIKTVAAKQNIQLQYEVEPGYGEDAASIQTKGNGIATVNIGIPVRYAHQHAGVFDDRDYAKTLKLVTALANQFDKKILS